MKEVRGDLLDMFEAGEFDVIIHGCNCFFAMKSGTAGQISKRWPITAAYDRMTAYASDRKLGRIVPVKVGRQCGTKGVIVNAYTQYQPGGGSDTRWIADQHELRLREQHIESALRITFERMNKPGVRFGMPLIGCGVAGGSWSRMSKIVDLVLEDHAADLTVVHWQPSGQPL